MSSLQSQCCLKQPQRGDQEVSKRFQHVPCPTHQLFAAVSLGILTEALGEGITCGTALDLPCSHCEAAQGYLFFLVGYWSPAGSSPGPVRGLLPGLILHPGLSLLLSQLEGPSLHPGHVGGAARSRAQEVPHPGGGGRHSAPHQELQGDEVPSRCVGRGAWRGTGHRSPGKRVSEQSCGISNAWCQWSLQRGFPAVAVSPGCWSEGCSSLEE